MNPSSVRPGDIERGPIAAVVIVGFPLSIGLSTRIPLWATVLVAVVLVSTVTVRIAGRTAARWLLDGWEFRAGRAARARARAMPADIIDVEIAAGVCGIRDAGTTLVAMIQLAPNLDLPTVISEKSLYTEDTVPVRALLSMLDQFGLAVEIDIVTTGQRVRPSGGYSMLYDQLVGSHPLVGNRLTWLVVRLDLEHNLAALARRGPAAVAGPKALAGAAHRIAGRLRERGIAAHALPAAALREASRILHAGVELTDLRETWGRLESSAPGRCVTSFSIDWSRLGETGLDDCWAWNRGRTTLVVSLTGATGSPRALVRFVGPEVTSTPDYLCPLGGRQSAALMASLPMAGSVRALPGERSGADIAPADALDELAIAIGPNGQILGAISGQARHALALPLFDPARYNPRRRVIDVHAALPVAQQIVLRAMVVGADIEVHSARPQHWRRLVEEVGDPESLRMATEGGADSRTATIAVFDQLPPQASAAPTTVSISEPGGPRHRSPDLVIDQVGAMTVDVGIPMRTVRVDLIEPRGEARYFERPQS
ncbi:type VII secretion protein EccE [Nocardia sp. NPDC127579]|uniref:type VII secretion protein EccE n=1 Tax=Nocardia sp. NPDC127579 TaxID=3345402 RepID=UPI00362CA149